MKPVQAIIYPREDLRVRLEDHSDALDSIGFQRRPGKQLKVFLRRDGLGSWVACRWDTPLKISGPGDALMIAHEETAKHWQLMHFTTHACHLL
jgi:hypothetical protein